MTFSLMMLPLSYGLSSALERAAASLETRGGRAFWASIETGLERAAEPGNDLSPEQSRRALLALRVLVQRAKPFIDELAPLFSTRGGAPQPEAGGQ